MKNAPIQRHDNLENEIIIAVIVLYLLIAGVMVFTHYSQPGGQATSTSSMSPSHAAPGASQAAPK